MFFCLKLYRIFDLDEYFFEANIRIPRRRTHGLGVGWRNGAGRAGERPSIDRATWCQWPSRRSPNPPAAAAKSNAEVLRKADVVVIAEAASGYRTAGRVGRQVTPKHLIVSIAAGVTLTQLEEAVGGKARVIR